MTAALWIPLAAVSWLGLAFASHWLTSSPVRPGELLAQALHRLIQTHARVLHRLRAAGLEHIPTRAAGAAEPLIVIANHTAGIDPLLLQACLPYEVRWMMAQDMREPRLEPLWAYGRVIFVDRQQGDPLSLREALRHLKQGGVLGVFPEGHIERPARVLLPFQPGIGFLIGRSGAAVLPAIIEGTPQVDPAWASLWRSSRSHVRFLPLVRYPKGTDPHAITADLHSRIARETGWPRSRESPRWIDGRWA